MTARSRQPGTVHGPARSLSATGSGSMANRHVPLEERFWSRVQKTEGCWLWTGPTLHFGYGSLSVAGRTVRAHRVSWELHNGPIPAGMSVLHHCDIPRCVNPHHLFLGTLLDNNIDRDRKGRQVSLSGPRHGNARLNPDAVRHIRASSLPNPEIAAVYGVDPSAVRQVRIGRTWRAQQPEGGAEGEGRA